jgi:cell division protein FtsB
MEIIALLILWIITLGFLFKFSANSLSKAHEAQAELEKQILICDNKDKQFYNMLIENIDLEKKNKELSKKNAQMKDKLNSLSSFLSDMKNGKM